MAVALLIEFPGGTQEQYDKINYLLGLEKGTLNLPRGLIFHVAGPTERGWQIVDVWESRADFDRFLSEKLGAAVRAVGVMIATPKEIPVYNMFGEREPGRVEMVGTVR